MLNPPSASAAAYCFPQSRLRGGRSQQIHKHLVELLLVQIDLHFDGLHVELRFVVIRPRQHVPVTSAALQVDIQIPSFFFRNQAGIQPRRHRQFIPQIVVLAIQPGILAHVMRRGRLASFDLVNQLRRHSGLHRNVHRSANDLFPGRPQRDVSRLWIEPEIEFVPRGIDELGIICQRA